MDNVEKDLNDLTQKFNKFKKQYEDDMHSLTDDNIDYDYFLKRDINVIGTVSSKGKILAKKPILLWSGSVQGGTIINLDVSNYNMLKVDTYPWGVYTPVYIDLTYPLGFVAANGYGGGTFSPEINSAGEMERLYAWVTINTAKNQILPALGFEKGTTKNARNGYSTYLIKKIWGVV